jgi:hypothetical protein
MAPALNARQRAYSAAFGGLPRAAGWAHLDAGPLDVRVHRGLVVVASLERGEVELAVARTAWPTSTAPITARELAFVRRSFLPAHAVGEEIEHGSGSMVLRAQVLTECSGAA